MKEKMYEVCRMGRGFEVMLGCLACVGPVQKENAPSTLPLVVGPLPPDKRKVASSL